MMIADATVQIMGQIVAQATAHIDAQIQVAREAYNIQLRLNAQITQDALNEEKKKRSWQRRTVAEQKKFEQDLLDVQKQADKDAEKIANAEIAKQFKKKQELAIVGVAMDTASAAMKIWADLGV